MILLHTFGSISFKNISLETRQSVPSNRLDRTKKIQALDPRPTCDLVDLCQA